MVSELLNYDICQFVLFCIDTGVILISDIIHRQNQCLVIADMKGCHVMLEVGLWEREVLEFHKFDTCV